ncbi:MAG: BCCT family transporter, partial [Firmicutes bacterium]|nr:BCCT family transporter [Bacillota bacterium]
PVITNFWFTILGGTGIWFELQNPGSISQILFNSGMPAMLLTIMQNMPASFIWVPLSIVLVVLFLVTTGAGVAYSMSVQLTNMETPYAAVRILCGVLIGVVAAVLVWIGADNAMNALQSFIVIVCLPLVFYYIAVVLGLPKAAKGIYADANHRLTDEEMEITMPIEVPKD